MTILQKFLLLCILIVTSINYFYINQTMTEKNTKETIKIAQIIIPPKKEDKIQKKVPESQILNHFKQAIDEHKINDSSADAKDILTKLKEKLTFQSNSTEEKKTEKKAQLTPIALRSPQKKIIIAKENSHQQKQVTLNSKDKIVCKKLKQEISELLAVPNKKKIKSRYPTLLKKKYVVKRPMRKKHFLKVKMEKKPIIETHKNFTELPFVKTLGVVKESKQFEEKVQTSTIASPTSYNFIPLSEEEKLSTLPFVNTLQVVDVSQAYEIAEPSIY